MKKTIVILIGLAMCIAANAQYINPSDTTISYRDKAYHDAEANYHGQGALVGVTYPVTLVLSPILGLIPAAVGASSKIDPADNNCPDYYLYESNPEYRNSYDHKCKKIKSKKAWTHFGIATAINTVLVLLLSGSN